MGTFETSKLLQKPQLSHSIYLFLNVSLSHNICQSLPLSMLLPLFLQSIVKIFVNF